MSATIIVLPVVRHERPRAAREELTLFVTPERFAKLKAMADPLERFPDDIANEILNSAIDNLMKAAT